MIDAALKQGSTQVALGGNSGSSNNRQRVVLPAAGNHSRNRTSHHSLPPKLYVQAVAPPPLSCPDRSTTPGHSATHPIQLAVQAVVKHQAVGHAHAVGLHGVALACSTQLGESTRGRHVSQAWRANEAGMCLKPVPVKQAGACGLRHRATSAGWLAAGQRCCQAIHSGAASRPPARLYCPAVLPQRTIVVLPYVWIIKVGHPVLALQQPRGGRAADRCAPR